MKNVATTKRSLGRRQGQGMTEYVIIVGLVAVMMIPAVSKLKDALANSFNASSQAIDDHVTSQLQSGG